MYNDKFEQYELDEATVGNLGQLPIGALQVIAGASGINLSDQAVSSGLKASSDVLKRIRKLSKKHGKTKPFRVVFSVRGKKKYTTVRAKDLRDAHKKANRNLFKRFGEFSIIEVK